jgi:hypothetical protein
MMTDNAKIKAIAMAIEEAVRFFGECISMITPVFCPSYSTPN